MKSYSSPLHEVVSPHFAIEPLTLVVCGSCHHDHDVGFTILGDALLE